jgi:hypothetical protein
MNRNLVGSILGMSSIKIANLVPICQQTWPPQAILVSDWFIFHWLLPTKSKQLQRRRFLEIDQSETRMACGSHVY